MTNKKMFLVIIAALFIAFLSSSFYTVQEGQKALISRLGKLSKDKDNYIIDGPGLHLKFPIIDQVLTFDTRLQTLDIQSSRIVTQEKKDVIVDYYVKWRIDDLPLYYKRTSGQIFRAEKLLSQQVNDGLRAEFGRRTISEVVSDDRAGIMTSLNKTADVSASKLGLAVVDVRIKRIDLPEEVSNAVFDRMREERKRVATEHRSQGEARAEAVRAEADAKATVIVATSRAEANRTRGKGDEEAAAIYAAAYSKNPDFYAFYRSLVAYTKTFDSKENLLVLSPESEFFRYFNSANAPKPTVAKSTK